MPVGCDGLDRSKSVEKGPGPKGANFFGSDTDSMLVASGGKDTETSCCSPFRKGRNGGMAIFEDVGTGDIAPARLPH